MAAVKNDGTVQFGSRVLTINAVTYVADDVTVNRPTITVERPDELGEPDGQYTRAAQVTGTATLQLATGSTVIPTLGLEFTETFVASIGAETFYLDNVDQVESNQSEKKVNVNFRKLNN